MQNKTQDYKDALGQQIDFLSQELMVMSFNFVNRLREGKTISDEEEYRQAQMSKQLKIIEATYNKLLKLGRIGGAVDNGTIDENFLTEIKKLQSTIKPIVRDMNEKE